MSTEAPERTYTPWWAFALVVLAGLLAIGGFVSSASESPLMRSYAQAEVSGKGTTVRDGKLEFAVLDVHRDLAGIGDPYFGAEPSTGAFTTVTLHVHNLSDEAVTFDSSYVVGIDGSGTKLPSDREAGYFANEHAAGILTTLPAGAEMSIRVAYDVPDGERLTGVQVHDSVFSRGAVITFKAAGVQS